MDDIYSRIQIVPVSRCLFHEGIIEKWVDQIAANIKDQGTIKNPVIVTWHDPYYVVLDGMHRFAAFQKLEIRDILVCVVDYLSPQVVLEGWDTIAFQKLNAKHLVLELFPEAAGYRYTIVSSLAEAKERVLQRKCLLAVADKKDAVYTVEKEPSAGKNNLDELCIATDTLDRSLSEKDIKVVYVDNALTLEAFPTSHGESVILRPQFTKKEVLERTLCKKIFPPKSTRHLIPERPLRVDLDLSLLRAAIDLETKNRVLQDHLQWCYENNRVRFYPESVHIFAD